MPKPVLTSSQVSGLLSTAIVLLFTTALFLSGFAIQQRTLRQLRLSIREPAAPSPRSVLPDHFKSSTTELEDGTVVLIESPAEREAREQAELLLLTVQQTPKEDATPQVEAVEESVASTADSDATPPTAAEPDHVESDHLDQDTGVGFSTPKDQRNPDPLAEDQRPISRAERRRLIKEELKNLAYSDQPMYYQRRLW